MEYGEFLVRTEDLLRRLRTLAAQEPVGNAFDGAVRDTERQVEVVRASPRTPTRVEVAMLREQERALAVASEMIADRERRSAALDPMDRSVFLSRATALRHRIEGLCAAGERFEGLDRMREAVCEMVAAARALGRDATPEEAGSLEEAEANVTHVEALLIGGTREPEAVCRAP